MPEDKRPYELSHYAEDFTEEGFWQKLGRFAKSAGREVVEKALILYYAMHDPEVPEWAKAVIAGALGYLVVPCDLLPDPTPGVGYADDLAVLTAAIALVAIHVTAETKEKARAKTREWFGEQ